MMNDAGRMSQTILAILAEVERTAPGLSLGQLAMFLTVVGREGIRMTELAARCGRTEATVSRGVRAMAEVGAAGTLEPAYGLVELLRGEDGRSRHLAPTASGLALAARLEDLLVDDRPSGLDAACEQRPSI